jgi:carbonic anhydrase
MFTFTTPELRSIIKGADPEDAAAAKQVEGIDFLEFADLESSVREDVKFLNQNPLILKETVITGWIYDIETGKVGVSLVPHTYCGHY